MGAAAAAHARQRRAGVRMPRPVPRPEAEGAPERVQPLEKWRSDRDVRFPSTSTTPGAAAANAMSGSAQSPRALLLPMPAVRERGERDEEDVDTEDDKI